MADNSNNLDNRSLETANVEKPPAISVGVLGWLRQNLFNTWYNALLTVLGALLIYVSVAGAFNFVVGALDEEYLPNYTLYIQNQELILDFGNIKQRFDVDEVTFTIEHTGASSPIVTTLSNEQSSVVLGAFSEGIRLTDISAQIELDESRYDLVEDGRTQKTNLNVRKPELEVYILGATIGADYTVDGEASSLRGPSTQLNRDRTVEDFELGTADQDISVESVVLKYQLETLYQLVESEGNLYLNVEDFRRRFNATKMFARVDYQLDGQPGSVRENIRIEQGSSKPNLLLGPVGDVEIDHMSLSFNRWEVIPNNLTLLMVGRFPRGELERVWFCLYLLALLLGLSAGIWPGLVRQLTIVSGIATAIMALLPFSLIVQFWIGGLILIGLAGFALGYFFKLRRLAIWGWILSFPIIMVLLSGVSNEWPSPEDAWLPLVNTREWGGLLLTFLLAIVGIVLSFPIGILLALGRRSKYPVISVFCVLYIELIRGVPLITILFMSRILMPLFLPGFQIEEVIRAMVGITMFSAAYMAENVRGGLQSIPNGQFEAAYAMGLKGWQSMILIVLPQALRAVIPAIVGQFIALFKDTTLVSIIGLLDFLRIAESIANNANWLGLWYELLAFTALVYWVFTYGMSYVSKRIEVSLGVGTR